MTDCEKCGMRDDDWFLCRTTDCPQRIVDAQDATIASLRDANKALTGERDELAGLYKAASELGDNNWRMANARATAAEAKLTKVEAETVARINHWSELYSAELRRAESLSAELVEARNQIERAGEDLHAVDTQIEHCSFSLARGVISQALIRIRSFLASKEASHAE